MQDHLPIAIGPEDNFFPESFRGMNEFVRTMAVGGDVQTTALQVIENPDDPREPHEYVVVQHMDRGSRFRVVRFDDDTYMVARLR